MRSGPLYAPPACRGVRTLGARHTLILGALVAVFTVLAPLGFALAPMVSASAGGAAACTGSNRDAFGGDVIVDADEWICGQARAYGGNVTVLGRTGGDVIAVGGGTTIDGEVDGSVTAIGGDVKLLPHARVGGDVQSLGGKIIQAPGAQVHGQVVRGITWQVNATLYHWPFLLGDTSPLLDLLFWMLAALACSLLLPSQLLRVRRSASSALPQSLVVGLGAYLVAVLAGLVLAVTCLGLPLALLLGAAIWVGTVFGTVAFGLWLGMLIVRGAALHNRAAFALAAVLGTAILAAAADIPRIGAAVHVLVSFAGLGAVGRTLLTARHAARWSGAGRF